MTIVIAHFLAALIVLTFSIFVFTKNRQNLSFAIFGFVIFVWLFASSFAYINHDESQILFWYKLSYAGIIFIPSTFYDFIYRLLKRRAGKITVINYAVSLVFILLLFNSDYLIKGLNSYSWGYYPQASLIAHPPFLLFFIALFCISIASVFMAFRSRAERSSIDKNRLKYLLFGSIFGTLGAVDFLPNYGLDVYPFGFIFMVIFLGIYAYAIIRYRLMDIDLVIKKGMVYSLSAGILASFFVVLVLIMTKYFSDAVHLTSSVITIVAALTIAVLFHPLKEKIQLLIDNNFYKRTYNYYEVIRDISRKLTSIFDLNTINEFIANTIYDTLGLNRIYVLSMEFGRNVEVVYQRFNKYANKDKLNITGPGNLTRSSEMIRFMIESEDILIKDELPEFEGKIGQNGIQRIRHELKQFGGEVAASVFIEGQLALILILGEKLSGDIFTREDINLLKTISDQISIAVKNARLYKDNLDSEKLASVGMMAATFAHEVRNPLTSLKTFAQLMPEKYNDEEFRDGFSKIVVGEIQKIDDLISDLLDFSTEKKSVRVTEYDLVGIVDETIDYVKGKLGLARRNIVIEKKYACESVMMMGDVKQLRQLFTNLVTNGCQAMNSEGILRVEIHPDGDTVDVAITDTGKGIHPDDIQRIFDPFVTNKESGTGLGLPISKKIVDEHNGILNVTSRLSEGSTFTVTLPVQKE